MSPDILPGGARATVTELYSERFPGWGFGPDDPRHGTVAGHIAHARAKVPYCEPCRQAKSRYDKGRQHDNRNGRPHTVPSLGARRRLQALQALGWSRTRIAEAAGWNTTGSLNYLMRHDTITRGTHERMVRVYDVLSMKLPPDNEPSRRARSWANRRGYPPPLAWDDDIDDPKARPRGAGYRPVANRPAAELLGEWEHLRAAGVSIHTAARQLGVTVEAIERAQMRHQPTEESA